MQQSDQDEGFIGPIKPLMSMSYRDYIQMINTGLGLPRPVSYTHLTLPTILLV